MKASESRRATRRCEWAERSEEYRAYHDSEWGAPVHDDRVLFEFLILEGAQAGLSWSTILAKREGYRRALSQFDPKKVARFTPSKLAQLAEDAGIVRNRAKIASAVTNAKSFLAVQAEHGSFDAYVWRFVGDGPRQNAWPSIRRVPARTDESDALAKDLARRGFKFVGTTICYAFMQAVGMVNDHVTTCPRWRALGGAANATRSKHHARRV